MSGSTIAPVRKEVVVACPVDDAFRLFTRDAARWWPLDTHSLHEADAAGIVFEEREGGEVYEVSRNGERAHWARVLVWEPPHRVVLAWHVNPGRPAPTELDVRFAAEGDATRVLLEHRGFEHAGDDAEQMRAGYDGGWDGVLARFAAVAAQRG